MNREEAIKHLETYSTTLGSGQTTQAQHEEAKRMAIKALEQEPCGDAIDRAEAIKIASGYCHPANVAKELAKLPPVNPQPSGNAIDRKLVCAFIDGLISDDGERKKGLEYIRNMPPVTPQPKTGHREYNDIYDHYLCGNCKTVVMDYDNFCPNCGAKMEDKG